MGTTFKLRHVFHDAWFATKGIKRKFWPAIITLIMINALAIMMLERWYHLPFYSLPYAVQFYLCPMISGFLTAPLLAGLCFTAVLRARHEEISLTTPFLGYCKIFSIAVTWFILSILSDFLWNLLHFSAFSDLLSYSKMRMITICFSMIVSALLLFALPLILDKDFKPLTALVISFQYCRRFFGKIIGTFLICYVIIAIIIFALGIGTIHAHTSMAPAVVLIIVIAIWFIPFLFMLYGVLYHRIVDAVNSNKA